jgi:hypothetical protein
MSVRTKMTSLEITVLRDGATGVCIRGVWHWTHRGEPCGRVVKRFVKRGLMSDTYYRDGLAGAWKTDAGRKLLDSTV